MLRKKTNKKTKKKTKNKTKKTTIHLSPKCPTAAKRLGRNIFALLLHILSLCSQEHNGF